MLDKIVAGFLTSYLGEYFENIDTEQVKISLWGGNVNLKHLKVRTDALRLFDIPFCISQGVIIELTISIPWSKLQSESIVISINNVTLVVEEKGVAGYSVAQCLLDAAHRRRQELANSEEVLISEFLSRLAGGGKGSAEVMETTAPSQEDEVNNTFSARLKATMINNVKLEIKNIRILYCAVSEPSKPPIELILDIEEILTYACDEQYKPTFTSAKLKIMHKVLEMKGVSLRLANSEGRATSMVQPFDFSVNVQYQPVPYNAQKPNCLIGIQLHHVQTCVNQPLIQSLLKVAETVLSAPLREEKRLLRPQSTSPKTDPRAWWKYAIEGTLLELRHRQQHHGNRSLSWKRFLDIKQKRDVYASLYARSRRSILKATGWLEALTPGEEMEMKCLEEKELPIETIKLARRIAVERVDLERGEYLKYKQQKQAASPVTETPPAENNKGWFSSWWSGSSQPSYLQNKIEQELEKESPEDQEQIKEMIRLVSADHWGEAERLVIAKELGFSAEEATELGQRPSTTTLEGSSQWCIFFHFQSSAVDFFHTQKETVTPGDGFLTLMLTGLTLGVNIESDNAVKTWAVVEDYSVTADYKTEKGEWEKGPIVEVDHIGTAPVVKRFIMTETMSSFVSYEFLSIFEQLQHQSALHVNFQKGSSSTGKVGSENSGLATEVTVLPLEVYVELSWLQQVVDFGIQAFIGSGESTEKQTRENSYKENQLLEGHDNGYDPFYVEPLRLTEREKVEFQDPKSRLLSLAHLIEREWIVDWCVVLKGVKLSIVEKRNVQASCIEVKSISVRNDVERKLKRSERLLRQNTSSSTERFGEVLEDWVDFVHVQAESISASALYTPMTSSSGPSEWGYILEPMPLEAVVQKNLFSRRQPLYPALTIRLSTRQEVRMNLSRCRLSVFCVSFSLITDFMRSVSRRVMLTRGQSHPVDATSSAPSKEESTLLHVDVLEMDSQYVVEHYEEKSDMVKYYESFNPTWNPESKDKKRFIEVKSGLLTVFHEFRTTYPHRLYELVQGHYHVIGHKEDLTLDLYVEQGGLSHLESRKGYYKARKLLEEHVQLPKFENNITLLEKYVEHWLSQHEGPQQTKEAVKEALATVTSASHTVPAAHLKFRCSSEAEQDRLKEVLLQGGVDRHVYTKTERVMETFSNLVPPELKTQRLVVFSFTAPRFKARLLEEELRDGESQETHKELNSLKEKELVIDNMNLKGEQFIQSQTYSINASRLVCCELPFPHEEKKDDFPPDLFCIGCGDVTDVEAFRPYNVFIATQMTSQPGNYPSPMTGTLKVRPASKNTFSARLNSSLLEAMELLYDVNGILFDKALDFSNRITCCVPWESEWSAEKSQSVEEQFVKNPFGGAQLSQTWDLQLPSCQFLVCYPKDKEEFTEAVSDAATLADRPFLRFHAKDMSIQFRQTGGGKDSHLSFRDPQLYAAESMGDKKDPEWKLVFAGLNENGSVEAKHTGVNPPPMLSLSDFIANGPVVAKDAPGGVRVTSSFTTKATGVRLFYSQQSMLRWLEGLTKGVVSRGLSFLDRQPFLYRRPSSSTSEPDTPKTVPLLPWPRPSALSPPPYTWGVMKKTTVLESARLIFSTASAEQERGSLENPIHSVSSTIRSMTMEDRWEEGKNGDLNAIFYAMVVQCQEMNLFDKPGGRLHTLMDSVLVRMNWLLFQPSRITRIAKPFVVEMGDYLFHGNSDDIDHLCGFVRENFTRNPFQPFLRLIPSYPPEPLRHLSELQNGSSPITEITVYGVDMRYFCFHLIESLPSPGTTATPTATTSNINPTEGRIASVALLLDSAKCHFQSDPSENQSLLRMCAKELTLCDLSHLSTPESPQRVVFRRHPSEKGVEESCMWLQCLPLDPTGTESGFSIGLERKQGKSALSCELGHIQWTIAPQFCFNARDTLASPKMMNSVASLQGQKETESFNEGEKEGTITTTIKRAVFVVANVTQQGSLIPLVEVGFEGVYYQQRPGVYKMSVQQFSERNGFYTFLNTTSMDEENEVAQTTLRPILFSPPPPGAFPVDPIPFSTKQKDLLDDLFSDPPPVQTVPEEKQTPPEQPTNPSSEGPWFEFAYEPSATGVNCTIGSTWFLMPHTYDLLKLYRLVQQGGLSNLGRLPTPLEERARDMTSTPTGETEWPQVTLQIMETSFLLAQHGTNPVTVKELQHGLILGCGNVSLKLDKKYVLQDNQQRTKRIAFEAVIPHTRLATLSSVSRELLKPFSTRFTYQEESSALSYTGTASCNIDKIHIHLELKYYELLLQSFVRHWVVTSATASGRRRGFSQEAEAMRSFPIPPRLSTMYSATPYVGSASPLAKTTTVVKSTNHRPERLRITTELGGVNMKVVDNSTTVFLELGQLTGSYSKNMVPNDAGEFLTTQESRVELPFLRTGVEGIRPLLDIHPAGENGEQFTIFQKRHGEEEEIMAFLGITTAYLEANAVVSAISLLYTPYARIVLPEYVLNEMKEIDKDMTLDQDLHLSYRVKMHISNSIHNHVTINAAGHHIYFNDSKEETLLYLDEGLTLRIINAHIHIKSETPLDTYARMGNGSYIIAERPSNTFHTIGGVSVLRKHLLEGADNVLDQLERENIIDVNPISDPPLNRKVVMRGQLHLFLTEPPKRYRPPSSTTTASQQSLHFQVDLGATVNTKSVNNMDYMECVMEVSHLALTSESRASPTALLETTSILSNWSLQVRFDSTTSHSNAGETPKMVNEKTFIVNATTGLEVNIRYSDIFVGVSSLKHAQRALQLAVGSVDVASFTAVLGDGDGSDYLNQLKLQEAVTERGSSDDTTMANTTITLPYLSIFLVDDSGSTVLPLLHVYVGGIETPVMQQRGPQQKWHLTFFLTAEYYDSEIASWNPFIEKVAIDFVVKHITNQSLEDVQNRKGESRVGVHVRDTKVHLSPLFLFSIRRLLELRERFLREQTLFAGDDKKQGEEKEEFQSCRIRQNATEELSIAFAEDDLKRFPQNQVLSRGEEFSFSFPSVNGRELPLSQQSIMVSIADGPPQLVSVAQRGQQRIVLSKGLTLCPLVVEIQNENGQKRIDFRSNVMLENRLNFPVILAEGLGQLAPQGTLSIPVEKLRQRIEFIPLTSGSCDTCSLGIRYESLPDMAGQTFVCVSQITNEPSSSTDKTPKGRSVPQVIYRCKDFQVLKGHWSPTLFFLFKVRSPLHRPGQLQAPTQNWTEDGLGEDINGIFTAPFFIRNKLQIDITVNFLRLKEGGEKSKKILGLEIPSIGNSSYEFVGTAEVSPHTPHAMTEVDPCEDVYITVVINQRSGGRVGLGQKGYHPACIYSPRKKNTSNTLTIEDQNTGSTLVLHLNYTGNEVVLSCPYFIVNQTQHLLHITDMNPDKTGKEIIPIAGLTRKGQNDIPPHDGVPILYNSERTRQLEEKAHLYIAVGYNPSGQQLQWSGWSERVPIAAIVDAGSFSCRTGATTSLHLSYSVEMAPGALSDCTRLVVIRPRWILINRSPRPFSFRQKVSHTRNSDAVQVSAHSCHVLEKTLLSETNTAVTALQILYQSDVLHRYHDYSSSFSIQEEGDYTFNTSYERLTKLTDYWPQSNTSVTPDSLPPIQPEDIVEIDKELYVRRQETDVMLVSCFRRCNSIMYVVVSIMETAPFVIENRSEYLLCVKQRDLPINMTIYPKTTKQFTWHNEKSIPCLRLWVTDGESNNASLPIDIDFSPATVIRNTEQFQQEILLPNNSNRVLFVRVRGIHGTSYAVSVAGEPTIDAYRTLPYAQLYYRIKIDALYMLLTDNDRADRMLLTLKPIEIAYEQGGKVGQTEENTKRAINRERSVGDTQQIDVSILVMQLDDERRCMKEKVVFQSVDVRPFAFKSIRRLLRTTPIFYMPQVSILFPPFEFHVEDSFVFDSIQYLNDLKEVWNNDRMASNSSDKRSSKKLGAGAARAVSFSEASPWVRDSMALSAPEEVSTPTTTTAVQRGDRSSHKMDWRLRTVFLEKFYIDALLLSISLYRSPGAQNDPMFQSLGVWSLLIRSVTDARLEWPQVDQKNVCQSVWMLANHYYLQYKVRMRGQLPNLLNVAGLHAMRGFVTDLLQAKYIEDTSLPRQKTRTGRRREAQFLQDTDGAPKNAIHNVNHTSVPLTKEQKDKLLQMYKISLTTSFETFIAKATMEEMIHYGHLFLKQSIRKAAVFPTINFRDVLQNDQNSRNVSVLASLVQYEGASAARVAKMASLCSNCHEVEQLRQIYLEGDPPRPLPHPDEGLVTYANLAHHLSWNEITKVCSVEEIRQYATLWKECAIGAPRNIVRLET